MVLLKRMLNVIFVIVLFLHTQGDAADVGRHASFARDLDDDLNRHRAAEWIAQRVRAAVAQFFGCVVQYAPVDLRLTRKYKARGRFGREFLTSYHDSFDT